MVGKVRQFILQPMANTSDNFFRFVLANILTHQLRVALLAQPLRVLMENTSSAWRIEKHENGNSFCGGRGGREGVSEEIETLGEALPL